MDVLTPEQAREIVAEIRIENGGLSEEELNELKPRTRRAFDKNREQLGELLFGLVDDLYTKDLRFAFELLQNAEDNCYSRVKGDSIDPSLTFTLCSDKIIIDSNEDGFNKENVAAICNARKSTKKSLQGYIGEKGIGFKSVFTIATKAHVQSGPFSFSFIHRSDQKGMGLITPIDEEYEILPKNVRTRITLTLTDPDKFHDEIAKEFSKPLDSILLFLKNLKVITITKIDAESNLRSTEVLSFHHPLMTHRGSLTKITDLHGGSAPESSVKYFHITKRMISNLPNDSHRTYKDHNGGMIYTKQAEVVLAFLIDADGEPIIKRQEVFAFLPMKDFGFKFLIQSDFITVANRQDVLDLPWNEKLLEGVAQTFRDAVLEFCEDETLQYQWMRYLPGDSISDPWWAKLRSYILELLKQTPIVRPRSGGALKLPDKLKSLPPAYLDEIGEPLLEDLADEIYLSPGYRSADISLLEQLGVSTIHFGDFLARVRTDLSKPLSRMKSGSTTQDWHTRIAKLLELPVDNHWPSSIVNEVRDLALVPLKGGPWGSCSTGRIYYPSTKAISIPTDLGLRLVEPSALTNAVRKELFSKLGVRNCKAEEVRRLIEIRYHNDSPAGPPNLDVSITHLRYLYWNPPQNEEVLLNSLWVHDEDEIPIYRKPSPVGRADILISDVYFDSDDDYGTRKLSASSSDGLGGFEIHYVNKAYLDALDGKTCRNVASGLLDDRSWQGWLQHVVGVRRSPRLADPVDPQQLSPFFRHIINNCDYMIVGVLKAHWNEYESIINQYDGLRKELSQAKVWCEPLDSMPLNKTVLPLLELKEICRAYGFGDVSWDFPFVDLLTDVDSGITQEITQDWLFLEKLGVNCEENLDFYLELFDRFARANQTPADQSWTNLLSLYEQISKHSRPSDWERVKEKFAREKAIFLPASGLRAAQWVRSGSCLWKAPTYVHLWHPLAAIDGYNSRPRLFVLFQGVLEIKDAQVSHLIAHIRPKDQGQRPPAKLSSIYSDIFRSLLEDGWESVRETFERDRLIYVSLEKAWHPPSSCLWTSGTRLSGKAAIGGEYPDLGFFFVHRLKVKEPDVSMFIAELKALKASNFAHTVERARTLIKDISTMVLHEGFLTDLIGLTILPVKLSTGSTILASTSSTFAIVDRLGYGDVFKGKVDTLHFTIEEIHQIRPFLSALKLERRYMSTMVKETSVVTESSKEPGLSDRLRQRADAILRCATHFDSPMTRDRNLSSKLRNADVFESESITKTVTLSLDGNNLAMQETKGFLHIETDEDQIRIHVPKKLEDRELCYLTQLPKHLVAYLTIREATAIKVFGDVLNASPLVVEAVLDEYGIVKISERGPPLNQASRTTFAETANQSLFAPVNAPEQRIPVPVSTPTYGTSSLPPGPTSGSTDPAAIDLSGSHSPSITSTLASTGPFGRESPSPAPVPTLGLSSKTRATSSLLGRSSPTPPYATAQPANPQTPQSAFAPSGKADSGSFGVFGSRILGTSSAPWFQGAGDALCQAHSEKEGLANAVNHFQSISSTKEYSTYSYDELRLENFHRVRGRPDPARYCFLLNKVIMNARKASLPHIFLSSGTFCIDPYPPDHVHVSWPIDSDAIFGPGTENSASRNKKIGAAGELYVFELFHSFQLPYFSLANWESTIRNEVCIHPAYVAMAAWIGRETADFTYVDIGSRLSLILISKGYDIPLSPVGGTLKFYLEVKTTTDDCNTRFFMSKAQYRRMRNMTFRSGERAHEVYVILRVYNLGRENMGMKIYVDPAKLESSGALRFEADQYTVSPP